MSKNIVSKIKSVAMDSRISFNTINDNVKSASYAVRGPIVTRSAKLKKMLSEKSEKLPFDSIVSCNIGNPQALEQKPLSFLRDVLSIVVNPSLLTKGQFNDDVRVRATSYLKDITSVGAYSESQGILSVREEVADYLESRDGYRGSPDDIFLTNGASEGVRYCMQTFLRDPSSGFKDGVLTPIPQYPLYSALITLLNGNLVPYYMQESTGWTITMDSLSTAIKSAREDGIIIRAMVIINPGNPTGNIFSVENLQEIITLCRNENICLFADEVYQANIWKSDTNFVSCRKVAFDLNAFEGPNPLQLISFHSISKGFLGECGLRGGYFECLGIPYEVTMELYKLASISLCSNVIGQVATGLMVNPPKPGEESFEVYNSEKNDVLDSLRRRASRISSALHEMPGISCTNIEGALYAFPTIELPVKAVEDARSRGYEPDAWYCMELLEHTGIVVVPGSGFGQAPGTYHFRTTILPPEDKVDTVVGKMREFHLSFTARYS